MSGPRKQRLELTWIGKEHRPKLEPRILLEDIEKSYHAPHRITDSDFFDNRVIFGDNLLALKALEQDFLARLSVCASISLTIQVVCLNTMTTALSIRYGFPW